MAAVKYSRPLDNTVLLLLLFPPPTGTPLHSRQYKFGSKLRSDKILPSSIEPNGNPFVGQNLPFIGKAPMFTLERSLSSLIG